MLWKDAQGQVSLAVTTLFWGAGATLRLVVLAWAAFALDFGIEHATQLTATVAVGIAVGSVIAAVDLQRQHELTRFSDGGEHGHKISCHRENT